MSLTATQQAILKALQDLLPRGIAWTRLPDAELTKVLEGLSIEFSRVEARSLDLLDEMDSRTTAELIDDYLSEANLPGSCDAPTTLEEKRELLHSHRLGFGDPNRQFYIDLLEALGLTGVSVLNRHEPFTAGAGAAGDPISNDPWQYTALMRFNAAEAGLDSRAECRTQERMPSHTHAIVKPKYYTNWRQVALTGSHDRHAGAKEHSFGQYVMLVGASDLVDVYDTDAGTWTQRTVTAGIGQTYYDVLSPNQPGIADFIVVGTSGIITRTSDGGATWGPKESTWFSPLRSIAGSTPVGALAVGDAGAILRSVGFSTTWSIETPAGGYSGVFHACASFKGKWIAVGQFGEIQYSIIGSGTWAKAVKYPATNSAVFRAVEVWGTVAYAAGEGGLLYVSEDGVNWYRTNPGVAADLRSLQALNGLTGLHEGLFIGTADSGAGVAHQVWEIPSSHYLATPVDTGVAHDIHGTFLVNDDLYAVGTGGVVQIGERYA